MPLFRNAARSGPATGAPVRLHIGCGRSAIPGWVNVDQYPIPGVDRVLDVGDGIPFENVSHLYAEHFLEHLSLHGALSFLRGCRRVLTPSGVLRVSTPNLDWVVLTHYHYGRWDADAAAVQECLGLNRAFHGWGHQFLYNRQTLTLALRTAGFERIVFQAYGASDVPELRDLERHELYDDNPDVPHVIIAEASGRGAADLATPDSFRRYHQDLTAK